MQASHNTIEDDIEMLRLAALQTLHQKKLEPQPRPAAHSQYFNSHYEGGYGDNGLSQSQSNRAIQLSPRSAAFVDANISILKRRKAGLDTDRDRWSRSPSPKYKSAKRKSPSPLPPARRSPPDSRRPSSQPSSAAAAAPSRDRPSSVRKYPKAAIRSPPPPSRRHESSNHNNNRSNRHNNHHTHHHREDRPGRGRADRDRSSTATVHRRSEESRPHTKSTSPTTVRRGHSAAIDPKEGKVAVEDRQESVKLPKEEKESVTKVRGEDDDQSRSDDDDEESSNASSSSDSESSNEAAIDLFASEDSESENEGRFKQSSNDKPAASFSSKMTRKRDLANSALPEVDATYERNAHRRKHHGGGGGGGRFRGNRSGSRQRDEEKREQRHRDSFQSTFREIELGE